MMTDCPPAYSTPLYRQPILLIQTLKVLDNLIFGSNNNKAKYKPLQQMNQY